jgi:uncharacterized protein (TIGR03435 family)
MLPLFILNRPFTRSASGADPVFTALEKQLGLRLVPAIGPRTYYVVDHVVGPAENC